jgi:hypothetical protein
MSDYTEQDTEQARQREFGSAGLQTTRLGDGGPASAPHAPINKNNAAGIALVAIGVLILLFQGFSTRIDIEPGIVLLTIASCFLFFAFWRRIYGLLIPGCILSGLALGVPFADLSNGVSVLWGLSLAFIGIFALGRTLFGKRSRWPIYPAVPLFAVGFLVFALNAPALIAVGMLWLPMLLIAAGLVLGARRAALA